MKFSFPSNNLFAGLLMLPFWRKVLSIVPLLAVSTASTAVSQQTTLILSNGMAIGPGPVLDSLPSLDPQGSVGSNTGPSGGSILRLDDGLRMTHVNRNRVVREGKAEALTKIILPNSDEVCDGGSKTVVVEGVGPVLQHTPFTIFGRRLYSVPNGTGKTALIHQGITEITPNYVRVQGMRPKILGLGYIWDQRIALSAIPPQALMDILLKNANPNRSQDWLDVVTLYWNSSRYVEAREVLVRSIHKFPELEGERTKLKELDQLIADQMFGAVEIARTAGQYILAEQMLKSFDASVMSLETKLKVDRQLEQFAASAAQREQLVQSLTDDLQKLNDPTATAELMPVINEIKSHLTNDTLERFSDYLRLRDDKTLKNEQRVALGLSGWLYGSGLAESNLAIVRSGYAARKWIKEYLESPRRNDQIIQELGKLESGTPRYVSRILANMPPPLTIPDGAEVTGEFFSAEDPEKRTTGTIPGRFRIEVPLGGPMRGRSVQYLVQLPPEYNPYRRYPCVVTLPSEISTTDDQVDWWVSLDRYDPQRRCMGEAAKHGYIVISPDWAEPKQPVYNFTENEHRLILTPLRDAFRRFSIDTDRVFLSGHFMGADAAWDIAMAHPDLWAGAIVMGGLASKYIIQYWPNAVHVPTYFVIGAIDGKPAPIAVNAKTWDNLLDRKQIDTMVTIYKGRGHDHFQEEIPRIIEWLNLASHKRNVAPEQFKVTTSRAGDRYFWWFETTQMEANKLVHPLLYEAGSEYEIESSLNRANNSIRLSKFPAKTFSIWLSPEIIDFSRKLVIDVKGKDTRLDVQGSTRVILEDVGARGDRQHPFWERVDFPISR